MPQLSDSEKESVAHYKRALSRWLEQNGVARVDRQLVQETMPPWGGDAVETHRIWLRDSLLWTCEEIEAGRDLYAFRGLLQAAGYAGKVGNDAITCDAYLTLRNLLERRIQQAEEQEAASFSARADESRRAL